MDGSVLWRGVLSSGCDWSSPMNDACMWDGRCQSSYKPACIRSRPGGSQVPEEVRREPACHSGGEMVPSHHLMFERRTSRLHQLTPAPPISGHIDRFANLYMHVPFHACSAPCDMGSPCRGTLSRLTGYDRPEGWPVMARAMLTHASCSP